MLVVTLGLGTLRTGGDMLLVRVILRFISVWGKGTSAVVCTLGTCCPLKLSVGIATCLNCLGCALMCAFVASTMRWRSTVAKEVLSLSVMPWMALTQSTIGQSAYHFVRVCDGGIGDAFVLELHSVG